MEGKLNIIETIKEGVVIGTKNILSLLIVAVLYYLTCWVPYLNIGTTVGLYKFIIKLSRGEVADPLILFEKENFDNLGNLILFFGIYSMGLIVAFFMMIIPFFVMSIAWSFAIYFLIDRKMKPIEALELSFKVTDGEKWHILAVLVLLCIAMTIVSTVLGIIPVVGGALAGIASLFFFAIVLAVVSVLFKHFDSKAV
ncbi:MAG: hypothetical protein J5764_02645 [Bacteroidales bacterium]|nr:hypothetical protein [Bacteroidales bacterium]